MRTERSPLSSVAVLPEGAIPPQAPFRLVYLFPAEGANGGLTSQQVLSTYGGVLLKVHYEMDGKQRSFIQYLPTSLLEEQLAEIVDGAGTLVGILTLDDVLRYLTAQQSELVALVAREQQHERQYRI